MEQQAGGSAHYTVLIHAIHTCDQGLTHMAVLLCNTGLEKRLKKRAARRKLEDLLVTLCRYSSDTSWFHMCFLAATQAWSSG